MILSLLLRSLNWQLVELANLHVLFVLLFDLFKRSQIVIRGSSCLSSLRHGFPLHFAKICSFRFKSGSCQEIGEESREFEAVLLATVNRLATMTS